MRHKGSSKIVTNSYTTIHHTYENIGSIDEVAYYQILLQAEGIHADNPLYFTELMLNQGDYVNYIKPNDEIEESTVYFSNNFYTLFYNPNIKGHLQIIRPNYDKLTTKNLTKSKCTVLAPHLDNELDSDKHENISLEYMNMTDQTIDLVR